MRPHDRFPPDRPHPLGRPVRLSDEAASENGSGGEKEQRLPTRHLFL